MIKRNLGSEIQWKLSRSLGPRQVGKTTLAKQLKTDGQEITYLDMENPED